MGERVAVTGAAGFIGSHVCEALLARADRVLGIDSFDPFYPRERKEQNLRDVRPSAERGPGVRDAFAFVELDVCDEAALAERLRAFGATRVVHLAAKAGVRPSIADPAGYARANVLGTQSVLSACSSAGVGVCVCASSSSVYGNNRKVPFAETDDVNEPVSPYAATKRACELIGHTHHRITGLSVSMLRFFTVYGPRQRPDLAISLFLRAVGAGEAVRMFGDGSMSRDFTYIDDIVAGVLSALDRTAAHGYRVWNLGSDRPVVLRDLIAAVGRTVGREPVVDRVAEQPGDVERTWADLSRSSAELGYVARTGLADGLARQWAWMKAAR
jgi:UDP-glucuronate 4-epimerase